MLLHSVLFSTARCSFDQFDSGGMRNVNQNPLRSRNIHDTTGSYHGQEYPLNHVVECPAGRVTPIHIDDAETYLVNNLQQQSNMVSSFINLDNPNLHSEKIFFNNDQNLLKKNNEFDFGVETQINEHIFNFSAPKNQNGDSFSKVIVINDIAETSHFETECIEECARHILNKNSNFTLSSINKRANETDDDEKEFLNESCMIINENKKRKTHNVNSESSKNQNSFASLNIVDSSEKQGFGDISKQNPDDKSVNQSYNSIKGSSKILKNTLNSLNLLKTYEARFKNQKISTESFFSSEIKELNETAENAKNFCKRWIQKEGMIEDSSENRIIFTHLLRLSLDIYNTIVFFKRSTIDQKLSKFSVEKSVQKNEILKCRNERNKNSLEKLKNLGIEKILEEDDDDILGNNLDEISQRRDIKFFYQEETNSEIHDFKISVNRKYYPASLTIFEESIFLCICSSNRYIKILKVDLNAGNYQEISKYTSNDEKNSLMYEYFGFGTKHTIIRSNSEGKLFLLKCHLRQPYRKKLVNIESFEILALNKDLKKLARVQVETNNSLNACVRPTILDFVVHDGLIYALDMENKCLKIFNESIELIKTIPTPESLTEIKSVHLVVSSKFILIGCRTTIYYILKNDNYTSEFKSLELNDLIYNIACYNEEYFIVRFIDGCYLFKIEENMTNDIKYTRLPSLDQLKYFLLTDFIVKDNFVYCICRKTSRIYRPNIFSNTDGSIQ